MAGSQTLIHRPLFKPKHIMNHVTVMFLLKTVFQFKEGCYESSQNIN